MLMVHVEHDLELQAGYFVRDYHLGDVMTIFFYCSLLDTWAKEELEPTDQPVCIEGGEDNENDTNHANNAADVRCKYGAAGPCCKYDANDFCPFLVIIRDTYMSWT
ncbi:Glutamine synthetase [Hordeum vulgare]|nr:Glutamine synthetase [Hordeum vulgare]